jgi:hypothetical protein
MRPWADDPLVRFAPYMATRWLVLELTALAAALLVLRLAPAARVRRDVATVLVAAAGAVALVHTGEALVPYDGFGYVHGWVALAAGGALLSAALATDAHPPADAPDEDHGRWLHAAGLVTLHVGVLDSWQRLGAGRHALPLLALALLAAGVRLERRALLAVGLADALWYVGWLAFDVFRAVVSFPFALAACGALVLGGAVLVQRRWPGLARGRVRVERARRLPGGRAAVAAPAALGLLLLGVGFARADGERERAEREHREAMRHAREAMREARAARGRPSGRAAPTPTPPPSPPPR